MKSLVRPSSRQSAPNLFVSLAFAAALLAPCLGHARPGIRASFFTVYPNAVGSKLDSVPSKPGHCGVCHYDFAGSGPKNPYGNALTNAGFALNKEPGISNAIRFVATNDWEGDGFTAIMEITNTSYFNTPTFPGLYAGNTNTISNVSPADIQNYLTPSTGSDTTPPIVAMLTPNGGQSFTANRATNVTWSATDASGIASINLFLSLDNGATYRPIAKGLTGTNFSWVPANRPTAQARIKAVAMDTYGNSSNDVSDAVFAIVSPPFNNPHGVPTTLRDFDLPGTQPFEHGNELEASANCAACHGNYNTAVEPQSNWQGSMMAHASRDLIFLANMAIANQDAPESGDLCLRCHFPRGWLGGRSVPTDGSRMQAADADGVSCAHCHQMVDPVYAAGTNPTNDLAILTALSFAGTNYGNGMVVIDPTGARRGPFTNAAAPHLFQSSAFHRQAAFCGSCHDVSNPAFQNDSTGNYVANALNTTGTNFSPHFMAPVERTYSEWLASAYNSPTGIHAPQFAGNKADGFVSTCQDCHMRDVAGVGCNTNINPGVPVRPDVPLHDLTGGSTWLPAMLTNLFPADMNAAAVQAGINRATALLQNAASLAVADAGAQIKVIVTNECGHKLPTGYPEGRRIWVNVKFFDAATNLLAESGAYDTNTGVLTHDPEAKIYEVHPGLETNLANALGLPPGPSLHFVLNNQVYEDNRIPPRGFANAAFAAFGGAPVGHSYADGQHWDDSLYALPEGAVRAEVKLYYQSTSKEFVEFLRDENITNSKGQELYDLWNNSGKCPPTLMGQKTWLLAFQLGRVGLNAEGRLEFHFTSRPGTTYKIEYTDNLNAPVWNDFQNNGALVATETASEFTDDFTANTSGSSSASGTRFYRFSYSTP